MKSELLKGHFASLRFFYSSSSIVHFSSFSFVLLLLFFLVRWACCSLQHRWHFFPIFFSRVECALFSNVLLMFVFVFFIRYRKKQTHACVSSNCYNMWLMAIRMSFGRMKKKYHLTCKRWSESIRRVKRWEKGQNKHHIHRNILQASPFLLSERVHSRINNKTILHMYIKNEYLCVLQMMGENASIETNESEKQQQRMRNDAKWPCIRKIKKK